MDSSRGWPEDPDIQTQLIHSISSRNCAPRRSPGAGQFITQLRHQISPLGLYPSNRTRGKGRFPSTRNCAPHKRFVLASLLCKYPTVCFRFFQFSHALGRAEFNGTRQVLWMNVNIAEPDLT